MSDIVERLRESVRACRALDRSMLLEKAASEIERLQSLTRFQDGVIRSGDVGCLTTGERMALEAAADAYAQNDDDQDCASIERAIRGLLERMK